MYIIMLVFGIQSKWLDFYTTYRVIPLISLVPIWHYT